MLLDPTEVSNEISVSFSVVVFISLQQSQKEQQLSGCLCAKKKRISFNEHPPAPLFWPYSC